MKWEYKVQHIRGVLVTDLIAEEVQHLEALGVAGWECFQVIKGEDLASIYSRLYFKRPVGVSLEQTSEPASPEEVHTALLLVDGELCRVPSLKEIEAWSQGQREAAHDWAAAVHLKAGDHDDVEVPPRPAWLV